MVAEANVLYLDRPGHNLGFALPSSVEDVTIGGQWVEDLCIISRHMNL